ncbi:MAG: FecR domain-containing protein [Verrucomicrobiota bacterium]
MNEQERWHELIAKFQIGEIADDEFAELEAALRDSAAARKQFHRACRIDSQLKKRSEDLQLPKPERGRRMNWQVIGLAAAVVILLGAMSWSRISQPRVIATIVSAEDATWRSSLPTETGSELTAGRLQLASGIATIRFRSGAEMMLEAPAVVSLKTPMRAAMNSGVAVLDVPKSAIGFVLETPEGHIVDHGTSFAVNVNELGALSNVEVIEGEVSVHHPVSGDEVRLFDQQGATLTETTLSTYEGPLEEAEVEPTSVIRIGTGGRSYSVIRANKEKWMHPDKLMVRRRNEPSNHERRSFFSFDLAGIDLDSVASVRLRLNQVPSGIGYASRLPRISDVAVYGLTNEAKAVWKMGTTWEEGPAVEDGVLLGHLEIPRSQQRGSRFFESDALLDFLKSHGEKAVTLILDAQVDPATGERVPSMVLAFASDTNPEAPGPMLEFTLKN